MKSRDSARLDKTIIFWQGCQFWNQTFDGELAKVDVDELRELLATDIIEPNTKLEK